MQHCTAAADLSCLLIGRSRKMACRKRIIILWYGGAKDFTTFLSDLTTPAVESVFPVYIRSIIRRRRRHVEGTGRKDCVAYKVRVRGDHGSGPGAAAATPGFGCNFENRSKR